jgi:ribosomal protein L14
MLKVGSYAYCIDITGVHLVKIFKVLGAGYKKKINLGNMVMVIVRSVNSSSHFLKGERLKLNFSLLIGQAIFLLWSRVFLNLYYE